MMCDVQGFLLDSSEALVYHEDSRINVITSKKHPLRLFIGLTAGRAENKESESVTLSMLTRAKRGFIPELPKA
jgi:hypothetical protein